ncbi:hypothetical protein [Pseudanabaena sp. 'Roaring Creek']|uniref:hypothetical protein n=1 Tax=Pseudanabaena sp. 'Roaring Creek' TaxID=1681830 RepID=UPI0006D7782F|nr:hypothetical protein [Pseudanabaena sp. 'Roaring Creek']
MTEPNPDSILDTVSQNRTRVKRDTSVRVKPLPSTPDPTELNKRTVRLSNVANRYYRQLKADEQVSVDCLLEALSIFNRENPDVESKLLEMARQISQDRQSNANRERARTMSKKFLD